MPIIDHHIVGLSGGRATNGMEGVTVLTLIQTVTQRWPAGGVGDGANAFVIPTMG